jgi:hypothetical protein
LRRQHENKVSQLSIETGLMPFALADGVDVNSEAPGYSEIRLKRPVLVAMIAATFVEPAKFEQ